MAIYFGGLQTAALASSRKCTHLEFRIRRGLTWLLLETQSKALNRTTKSVPYSDGAILLLLEPPPTEREPPPLETTYLIYG